MKLRPGGIPIAVVLLIVAFLLYLTWSSEKRLAEGSAENPEVITIEQMESGPPANPYRILGPHLPLYNLVIYELDKKDGTVNEAWYPVVAQARYDAVMKDLKARHHGDMAAVTKEEFGKAMGVKVFIKTRAYRTTEGLKGAIDRGNFPKDKVSGLVLNHVSPLNEKEIGFIKGAYPNFKVDEAVFFDSDRAPSSPSTLTKYLMGMVGCLVLAVVVSVKR